MVARSPRSRSHTLAESMTSAGFNHRPKSSQSTASAASDITQLTQPNATDSSYHVQTQVASSAAWQNHNVSAEHSSYSIPPSGNPYPIDANLQQHIHMSFAPEASFQPDPITRVQSPGQYPSIEGRENSVFDTGMDGQVAAHDDNGVDGARRKKGSASSQANDNELRRLFRENHGRDLHDVALQVVKDEKGPKSEKAKQIFGMLWLSTHITRSSTSVPRNRVFASYAKRCGTERVPPLNPASFGKLVRIIFPGIQTRRLGVRGESKYHYVELALIIDDGEPDRPCVSRLQSMARDSASRRGSVNPVQSRTEVLADAARFSPADSPRPLTQHAPKANVASGSLYLQPADWNSHHAQDLAPSMIPRPLKFPTTPASTHQGKIQLELPSIGPFLPSGADIDAVDSLTSVYRSHCLLAIDNFRFCKTDKFCDSYKSLAGLLTTPGQKLLAHPNIAGWIRECDWLKYQKMVPMLDLTLLAQVPRKAMAHMEHVAMNMCGWIGQFFQNQPQHVLDAMQGPANIFVSLLQRYLRVNRAALDVASVLESVDHRDQLWNDWITHLQPFHVLQNSLCTHGHKRVLHILTQEVRMLLSPLQTGLLIAGGRVFNDSGVLSDFQKRESDAGIDGSSGSIIGRMFRFVESLSSRFPSVDARSLLNHIDVIGSNASRNMTLGGALSLGHWWRIKLFVDESSYWLAEKGGFVESGSAGDTPKFDFSRSPYERMNAGFNFEDSHEALSRPRTGLSTNAEHEMDGSVDRTTSAMLAGRRTSARTSHNSMSRPGSTAPVVKLEPEPVHSRSGSTFSEEEGTNPMHDDSGIGLGIDEDFNMDSKYHSFVEGVHGSDPADVVVC